MFGKCSRQAGELAEESVSLKIAHTAADGKKLRPEILQIWPRLFLLDTASFSRLCRTSHYYR